MKGENLFSIPRYDLVTRMFFNLFNSFRFGIVEGEGRGLPVLEDKIMIGDGIGDPDIFRRDGAVGIDHVDHAFLDPFDQRFS